MNDKIYAELVVKQGLNLKQGEEVFIVSSVETHEFARAVTKTAYECGAKKVTVVYSDEQIQKTRFENESTESIIAIPAWEIAQRDYIPDNRCAYLNILSESPDTFESVDADKMAQYSRARHKAFHKFYDMSMGNTFKWCLVGYPSKGWANKVFPNDENAMEKLRECIYKTMRLDASDPLQAWKDHEQKLGKMCAYLNDMQFEKFVYKNSIGTDLVVGMPKNYVFMGGGEYTDKAEHFTANMPTEEVFSAPHKDKVDGIVYSSMPLVVNGKVVKDFYFKFKDGKVVDYGAKEGVDVLKGIIETDEGSARLGEIALVGYSTPIRQMQTLFYNTLFDENASCHFALGKAYGCIKDCESMTEQERLNAGLNHSLEHVDFMIGTQDLSIVGIKDGKEYPVFINGEFAI